MGQQTFALVLEATSGRQKVRRVRVAPRTPSNSVASPMGQQTFALVLEATSGRQKRDHVVKVRNAPNRHPETPLQRRHRRFATVRRRLLAVQGKHDTDHFAAGGDDGLVGLALGSAVGDDVVDDDHPGTGHGRADQRPALAMRLGFLAIERGPDVDAMVPGQCHGDRNGNRDALVRGPEQHVRSNGEVDDLLGVRLAHHIVARTVRDGPQVEEVGALAARLQDEVAEQQGIAFQHRPNEVLRCGSPPVRHPASAWRWASNKVRIPASASPSSSSSCPRPKAPLSAVPWTSMKPRPSIMTTFMSVSARESSA